MRLNKSAIRWVLTLSLITLVVALPKLTKIAWAHGTEDHEDNNGEYHEYEWEGPHGGQVIPFGQNHLELTADHRSGDIALFMLDMDMETIPMPQGYSGTVELSMTDGYKKMFTLKHEAEGAVPHLEAETGITEIGAFNAVVNLDMGMNQESFQFRWAPAAHGHN